MDHHRRRRDSYDSDPETNNNESSSMSKSELSRQIDKLNRDLQRRDRELEDERQENLRVLERIKKLEKDKVELRREVDDFRDEANEYKKSLEELKSKRKPGEEVAKEKYEVALQQKNHEIRQLLDDIEKLEGEKSSLQSKLNELKDSLQDATRQLEGMTQEHVAIKSRLQKSEAKIKELQDDKVILEIKLKDLLSFKQRHDQYLENLCSAVDVRVDVWKKMMFQKDEEIDRLNVKLATLANQIPTGHGHVENDKTVLNQLKMKLLEREATISTLNEKLALATQDLNSATEHINSLNAKLKFAEHPDKSDSALESLQFKVNRFKSQLDRKDEQIGQLEKEVEEKSRELTSLSARLHAYETGVYGLSEAISEIKELKTQLRIRNNQIENQTQELNILNLKFNDIVDENEMLRDKLGVEALDMKEETHKFTTNRQKQLMDLKSQISSLEEEIVQLKSQNYSYRKQLMLYETNATVMAATPTPPPPQPTPPSRPPPLPIHRTPTPPVRHTPTPPAHHPPTPPAHHPPTPQGVQVDDFGRNLAANFDETDWKDRYEIVLGENQELRKGLQEILETMQQMTDEGTSDVLIQCPILENLLREMSARGLIHYPYGISSFHLKVCNLEGKNAQLREEIHRLKLEEKQNRADLINANGTIQSLKDKLANATVTVSGDMTSGPSSSDGMVLSLQSEIESLHAQIRHLKDVLQFESTVDSSDQSVQTLAVRRLDEFTQTERIEEKNYERLEHETKRLHVEIDVLTRKVTDQAIVIEAKDKVIEDFKLINFSYPQEGNKNHSNVGQIKELEEALNISRETASSLQDRLKAKEENLNQYRSLLAEIRNEMTAATNRHVQEMRALQLTIYQQQQAFTRMKSTLSQPVKDTLNIEGTIKDQLTRIHELEDEVSELQHTLGNVASQLTTARSEAHRWRCTADARLKELDVARESQTNDKIEELSMLREKLKQQESKLLDLEAENIRLRSAKDSITDIVNVIRNEHQQVTSGLQKSSFKELNDRLVSKDKEIEELQTANKQLQSKISALQVRVSKMNAVSKHLGHSVEMEQLKSKYMAAEDERVKLETELRNLNKNRDVEDEKKRKAIESMARWEEAKKWKKTVEKLEGQIETLKKENEKLTQKNKNLQASITRLDKMVLDCKKLQPPMKSILKQPEDSIEIDKLKFEIQDLQELVEKTEFEGREKVATLEMEIRCLKERIVSQERQLAAYQVAQKGDPKLVSEIEKMAGKEEELHKTINSLEEDNLHLKLQMEQLRLDTPRLRDRVQQLQRLVEVLKSEKPETVSTRANSQKSLSELERTITALKQLIEKIQSENKRLRMKPSNKAMSSASSENLRVTLEALIAEKKSLMDQLAMLEDEKKKYQKLYIEASSNLESLEIRFQDAERRAKSSEMKLRTFLGEDSGEHSVYERMRSLEEALSRKTKLLDDAKLALKQAAGSK